MGANEIVEPAMEEIFEGAAGGSITASELTFLRPSGHLGDDITSAVFSEGWR